MLLDTLDRLAPVAPLDRTLILTNASLTDAVAAAVPAIQRANIVSEPRPAGTAAALAWAAHLIALRAGQDATMVSVHADSAIGDVEAFRTALLAAAEAAANEHSLVTVGIVPTHPDTGLGYIRPGTVVRGSLRRVDRFLEKPDRAMAESLVAAGALWNSGIFAWRVGDFLDEVAAHCPEVASALTAHGDDAEAFFGNVRSISIDVGVLERSSRVMVIPGDFGWSDVGTWAALRAVRQRDSEGNAPTGRVLLRDSRENVVHADGTTVVCYGVEGLVVVALNGMTLVTTVERAADLKTLVDALPCEVRER